METDSPLRVSIELAKREHGRDAYSNSFEVVVDGNQVRYRGPYGEGERGVFESETVEFELTDDQLSRLRRELDNYDLLRSVGETFETDTGGNPYREIDAEATVVVGGETHELRIAGPTSVRGEDTGMEHHRQARGLERLCWQFKEWAEADTGGAWWNPFG